jgi:hypothetical protein
LIAAQESGAQDWRPGYFSAFPAGGSGLQLHQQQHCMVSALPDLSSERTRISCHAALDRTTCAPFRKERRMKFASASKFHRKSGVAEGPAVRLHRQTKAPRVSSQICPNGLFFGPKTICGPPRHALRMTILWELWRKTFQTSQRSHVRLSACSLSYGTMTVS